MYTELLYEFEKIAEEVSPEELETLSVDILVAIEKQAKDSSYLADFLAGVEPTGVYTFEHGSKNKEHHAAHQWVGNVGGLVGGGSLGIASTAGTSALLAKLFKKKSPSVAKMFDLTAKGAMDAFDPRKLSKYLGSFSQAGRYQSRLQDLSKAVDNLDTQIKQNIGDLDFKNLQEVAQLGGDVVSKKRNLNPLINKVRNVKNVSEEEILDKVINARLSASDSVKHKDNIKELLVAAGKLDDKVHASFGDVDPASLNKVIDASKKVFEAKDKVDLTGKYLSKKYYGGEEPTVGIGKTLAATGAIASGGFGGILNSLSAHTQYSAGRRLSENK